MSALKYLVCIVLALSASAADPPVMVYFNAKARGWFPMLVAEVGEVDYVFEGISQEEWARIKTSTPLGQLPTIRVDDIYMAQSLAVVRFFAKRGKEELLGSNEFDYAVGGMMIDEASDIFNLLGAAVFSFNQTGYKTLFEQQLPTQLTYVTKLLNKKNRFTNKLTAGEIGMFANLDLCLDVYSKALDNFPEIQDFMAQMSQVPGIIKAQKRYANLPKAFPKYNPTE
eukprot:NODE_1696_length_787_cov_273.361789_g1318_i0.p1 GENE.NODE_1696_length_787_cov_273.361789_g1318_i0~~NODE_1696_length_787_cov_273.361789_g1318_i0.p1  ORF type:complete len:244 (+),score=67.39 NODE_1696_length_787_cov_273.361789_g1318_i0:56-733(+)